jgi:hypothetical protein
VEDDDMKMARQVAQEAEDEEMARRYTTYEQESASREQAQYMATNNNNPRQQPQRKGFFGRALPLVCCAVAITIPLLFVFGVFNSDNVPGLDFNWDDFVDNDPYNGQVVDRTNPKATSSWNNQGKGLTLEVLNALEDNWQTSFQTALINWDNGTPDALTLVTQRIPYEFDCRAVNGKLKVCNGNYGNTRWKGLNEISIQGSIIRSSTAKMNEYYLTSSNDDARLYTMCHEIGHGFGLPHWDEDFFNQDLGNCMDYTNRPQDNKTPDTSNFEFLAELYGTKDGYVSPGEDTDTDTTTPPGGTSSSTATADPAGGKGNEKGSGGPRGRTLSLVQETADAAADPSIVTDKIEWEQLQPVYQQAMREFYANHEYYHAQDHSVVVEDEEERVYSNSRLLYATDYLESHEIQVSENVVVHVHFLLA